jgi:5-hydroxyisourate hydrolase-like protein (transthyretin family)
VRVEDQDGVRLAGADVYLEPPAALGQGSVSFGDLRKIGVTGEDGTLLATALPDGAAVVVANIGNLLNGARGLDATHGIPVLLTPFRLVEAHVVLPMKSKQLGTVAGRVRGPRGDPLGRVTVIIGFHRVFGDEEGRFEIRSVAAGEVDVQASRSGYRSATARVVVEPSGTTACDLELAWKEEGSLALAGRVTSRAGTPVAGASLYLIDEKGRGTLRSVRTDADGRYAFLSLPDRLAETACRVQAGAHRQGYPSRNVPFEQGLDTANLDIVLPPQMVLLRLHLVDGATGKAVTRCRVEPAQLDESKAPAVRGFMGTHAEGRFEHWFAAGSYRLLIEAPEHAPAKLEVSLDPPGAVVTRELEMASLHDNAAPITLVVILRSGDAVVKTATIEVLDAATGAALSRYEGHDGDGRLSMPATAGHRRVRVSSSGYQVEERDVELLIEPATTTLTFDLDSE